MLSITPLVNYSSMSIEDVHLPFEGTEVISLEERLLFSSRQINIDRRFSSIQS